jgi:lysophospholipase L1-like esterase
MRMGRVSLACLIGLLSVGVASAAPVLNLPETTAAIKAKIARGGQGNIVLLGDSLAFGSGGFRPAFTERMQSLYGNAGLGFLGLGPERGRFGAGWSSGVLNGSDPAPHHGLDGLWLKALPGTSPLPSGGVITAFWDSMELHYVAEPKGGAIQLSLDYTGVPIARLDTNAATPEVRTFTYHFAPGVPSAVRFQPDGTGPVTLLGMNLESDGPGVRVHRASNGGWGINQFLQRDWTFDQELRLLDTDVVMVAIGANDNPFDNYISKLDRFVDRLKAAVPTSEIVLVAPYDFGRPGVLNIVESIEQVARDRGLGFINLYETAGNYDFFVQNGYLADGLHFTEAGGAYVGNLVAEAFRTNGATLNSAPPLPEPGGASALLAAALLTLRRRRH